jgi:hypothetical protein
MSLPIIPTYVPKSQGLTPPSLYNDARSDSWRCTSWAAALASGVLAAGPILIACREDPLTRGLRPTRPLCAGGCLFTHNPQLDIQLCVSDAFASSWALLKKSTSEARSSSQ